LISLRLAYNHLKTSQKMGFEGISLTFKHKLKNKNTHVFLSHFEKKKKKEKETADCSITIIYCIS